MFWIVLSPSLGRYGNVRFGARSSLRRPGPPSERRLGCPPCLAMALWPGAEARPRIVFALHWATEAAAIPDFSLQAG